MMAKYYANYVSIDNNPQNLVLIICYTFFFVAIVIQSPTFSYF